MTADSLGRGGLDARARPTRHRRSPGLRLLVVLAITGSTTAALAAQQQTGALTNADLIRMTQAGIEEATIVNLVESSPVAFETSASAVIALKNAGAGDRVIHAAVAAADASLTARSDGLYPRPEERAVLDDRRTEILQATALRRGITKGSRNNMNDSAGSVQVRGHGSQHDELPPRRCR